MRQVPLRVKAKLYYKDDCGRNRLATRILEGRQDIGHGSLKEIFFALVAYRQYGYCLRILDFK